MSQGKDISGANIDLISGKIADGVLNNNPRSDSFDRIKSLLKEVKDRHNNSEPDEYFGYCLYSSRWSVKKFQSIYPPESKFYKDVIFAKNKKKIDESVSILCCRVHIPEITGILPFPDMLKIFSLQQLYKEESITDSKNKAKVAYHIARSTPEIMKIDLQPKFFMYTEENNTVPLGQLCKVKFLEDSYPTRGMGLFLQMLDSNIQECTET